jgi:type I restriction enzyme, S subunit
LPVLSATQENGIVFRNDLDIDIKFDTHALSNYKVVSPGDYIISLRSFQGGFELSEKRGIISPAYTVFAFNNQEKNRQNSTFWKYLFKRYDFIESLKRLTFGIRDGKAISFNQFSTLKLSFPNFDEQNKIATLLHELDRTITLHEEKKRQLERLKSALLQKMFADKSGYPAVRFEGFSNEWEHCKLGDVADITTGSRNHQDSVTDGKYPFFVRSDKVERLNEYDFDTKAILVPGDGRIGEIFHYYNGKFVSTQ